MRLKRWWRSQSHRVAERERWRQVRRLGSVRATRMRRDLGRLVVEPCGQCGHERVAHEVGGGYCGALVEEVGIETHNPSSWIADETGIHDGGETRIKGSIESLCWCGKFKPPVQHMRRIP